MASLVEITSTGTDLQRLRTLLDKLAREIDCCEDQRNMPGLARQYRETLRQINELEEPEHDDLDDLIGEFGNVR